MAGQAFTDLNTISLSDNFRAWFDKTNEIVGALNPVAVYGVTPGAGITVAIDSNAIATIGLSLDNTTPGDTEFSGSLTFSDFVSFTGLTMDVSGVTLFGNVVRSINGKTGAVTLGLTGINDPTTATGDFLIKSGGTFAAYSMFNGDFESSFGNMSLRFAASGGMLLGGSTSGTAGVHAFANQEAGTIQLALDNVRGATTSYLHLKNIGYTGGDVAESGTQLFFGRIGGNNTDPVGFVVRPGGSNGAYDTSGPMLVLDQTNRRIGINGVTKAAGPIHIITESTGATPADDIIVQNVNGATAPLIRTAIGGGTGEYTNLEGTRGFTTPRLRGFRDQNRIKTIVDGGMPMYGIELRTQPAHFAVQGSEVFGSTLSPVLVARHDGTVIFGGISADDAGSTYGKVNIVSGNLLFGGTHGKTTATNGGLITVMQKGGTVSYKNIFADAPNGGDSTSLITNVTFTGNITDDMVMDLRSREGSVAQNLKSVDEEGNSLQTSSADKIYLEFFKYSSTGSKRRAVGNFDIQVTMPAYLFVNDINQATSVSPSRFKSVIGAVALIDDQKEQNIPTDFEFGPNEARSPLLFSPSEGYNLMSTDHLASDVPQRLTFNLRGNCTTGVRVALIVSKTHAQLGMRSGAIYRGPGTFTAKFSNVE